MKILTLAQWNEMTLKEALLHIVARNPGCCRLDILNEIRTIVGDPDSPSSDWKLSTPLKQLCNDGYLKRSQSEYEHSGRMQSEYTRTKKAY